MAEQRKVPFYTAVKHPATPEGYFLVSCVDQQRFDRAVSLQTYADDTFIVSYPKCGTTWLMNIIHLMRTGGARLAGGELLERLIPFLEFDGAGPIVDLARPRFIKTHLYYDLAPQNRQAKYVFVARNPKDCLVSFYYHTVGFDEYYKFKDGTLDDFFEVFMRGVCDSGDYFKMVPEWYAKSLQQDNIHFMLYEDMKNDIRTEILKMADFLAPEWKEKLEKDDCALLNKVIELSSFKSMQKDVEKLCSEQRPDDIPFVRKGIIGDWKTKLSPEQSARVDAKLKEAGSKYPGFDKLWSKYEHLLK